MTKKTKEELLKELERLKERLKELETANLEQKKVIEELSESEVKYRLLFDAAPVGIGIADLKGNIIDANRNMQDMSGFSLEEYRAIGVEATYADPKERKLFLKSLREKGKVRDWEGKLKRKDGSEYHALLNADMMELGGRKVLLGIIRDITERNRIEIALKAALANAQEEKNKSDAIISALGDGIIIQDTDYKITYQNQVQNEIYGDKTGELCYKAYEGRDQICDDCPVERTFRDGKIHRSEKKVTTDNGDLYFELTSSPLRDSNGKIIAGIKVVREITEQKRLEQTLRESEEKYRRLVETLMEGIWVLDKDANTTFVNPRMAQMLGFTVDEMLGKHLFSFMDEQGRMNATRYLERREQNVKEQHDFEFIRKDGTRIYTSLETSPITDENGNYSGAVAAIADITERKRAEEKLREGEQFLESIFASIQDGIGVIDSDMKIIRVNKTAESWYPYAAPLVGKKCYEAYHNRKERCEKCPAWETLKTGRSAYNEVPKHGLEGKKVGWLEIYSYPLNDTTTGKMKGVIEYVRDITERKRVEQELNKSKQLLERTFLSLSDAVFIIDAETVKIIDCNKAASKIFGYEKDEMLGRKTAFLHVDEEALAEFRKKLYAAEEEKGFLYLPEFRMKRKNGECFLTENTVTPLVDDIGKHLGWVSVVRDISELKRAQVALLKSEEKFRGIFEQSPIAIELYDREGNLIDANRSCFALFGINDIKSVIGFKLFEDPNIAEDKKKRLSNGESIEFESVFDFELVKKARLYETTKSGKCYLDILIVPLIAEERERYGYLVHLRDITERKRAEEELKQSEEKYRLLIENIREGVFVIQDAKLAFVNQVFADISGYVIEEIIGTDFFHFVAPEDLEMVKDRYYRRQKGENVPSEYEFHALRKNGEKPVVNMNVGIVTYRGRVASMGILRDITEHKRVEEQLKQSEEKYRLLIENIQEGVFVIQDAKMRFANQGFAQITGYNIEEIIGIEFNHFVAPEDLKMVQDRYYRRQKGEDIPKEYEFHVLRKHGEKTLVNMSVGIVTYRGRVASMGIVRDITEQKRVEKLIKRSEEKYRNLVELTTDIIYVTDKDRKHVFMNDAGYRILGAEPEEVIGHHWSECVYPDDREKSFKKFREMIDKGIDVFEFENRYFSKRGRIINVLHNVRIMKNDTGEIIGTQGIARDITERKQIEQVLLESEERYRNLFEDSPISLWEEDTSDIKKYIDNLKSKGIKNLREYFDRHPKEIAVCASMMKVVDVNKFTINLFKAKSKGDFIEGLEKIFTESSYEKFKDEIIAMSEGKTSYESEDIVKTLTGDKIHISLKWVLTPGNEKTYSKRLVSIIDITESKRAEEELNQRAQLAMLGAEVGIALTQGDTLSQILQRCTEALVKYLDASLARIWTFNEAQKVLELRASGGIYTHIDGSHSRIPLGSFKIGFIAKERKHHLTNSVIGDPRIHDQEWAKQEGMVAFAGYPLIVEDRLVGVVALFARQPLSDFALKALASVADTIALGIERKKVEEERKRYAIELEESNRLKELFIDIMHHDLLNPLNVANGYVELFLEDESHPRKKSYLETIKRNLVKGMELIDNATKFSKLESMKYIEFEEIDLKMVIGEAIENLTPMATRAGMSIENDILESMPAKANKIIEDVFINVISNAIKYAPEGKKIVVEGKDKGKFWSVRIKDFGAGVKDAEKTQIFERFHREEKKGVKGSGLGLAIARKIVELHNGRIWVEDNPEGGAVFVVEIPKSES